MGIFAAVDTRGYEFSGGIGGRPTCWVAPVKWGWAAGWCPILKAAILLCSDTLMQEDKE